jgi:hypothetical protein
VRPGIGDWAQFQNRKTAPGLKRNGKSNNERPGINVFNPMKIKYLLKIIKRGEYDN